MHHAHTDDCDSTLLVQHTAANAHVTVMAECDGTFVVFALWYADDSYTQESFADEATAREVALAIAGDQLLTGM